MIKQIVKNPSRHLYEPIDEINKKLNHFRKLSADGLNNLSDDEFAKLGKEISEFFNVSVAFTFWPMPSDKTSPKKSLFLVTFKQHESSRFKV